MAPLSRNALKSGAFTDSCSEPENQSSLIRAKEGKTRIMKTGSRQKTLDKHISRTCISFFSSVYEFRTDLSRYMVL